jgi:hypothetical protein
MNNQFDDFEPDKSQKTTIETPVPLFVIVVLFLCGYM